MDQAIPNRGRCELQQSPLNLCRRAYGSSRGRGRPAYRPQYPLDSVKSRLQAYAPFTPPTPKRPDKSSYEFKSFTDCVRHTYKTEGLHGFYRGMHWCHHHQTNSS